MSQFPQPGIETPGVQIGQRAVPRVSQLVGVITGVARSGMSADQSTAAELVQSGRARVQQVRAMDASRQRTAEIKSGVEAGIAQRRAQKEAQIAQNRAQQRMENAQIKAMNMLMSEHSENPEWLARHATTEFQNATTASEKRIWMGLIDRSNQLREKNEITAEREQAHSRKQQYNLSQQTARLQIGRLQGELQANPELQEQLIGTGDGIHDRLLEFVIGTLGEAVPGLGDISRDDPQFEFKSQLRDDLILSISQAVVPLGNELIKQHRDQLDRSARTSAEHGFAAALDTLILDLASDGAGGARSAVNDYVTTIDDTELFAGLDTSSTERARIEGEIRLNAAKQLGTLPDGINARTASEAIDALVTMPDGSLHPRRREIEETFNQVFENTTQRRTQREIVRVQEKIRQMWPNADAGVLLELTLADPDVQNLRMNIREEMGIPVDVDPASITDSMAQRIAQIDSSVDRYLNPLIQQNAQMNTAKNNAIAVQTGQGGDIDVAWEFSMAETMRDGGALDDRLELVMNNHLLRHRGLLRTAAGLAGFADIDWDNFTIDQLITERGALMDALQSQGLVSPHTATLRNDMVIDDPDLKRQYDEFWFKANAVDVAWLNQTRADHPELPADLVKNVQVLMRRGVENGWTTAAQYVSTLNQDARAEFLTRLGEGDAEGRRMRTALETWMSFQRSTMKDVGPQVAQQYFSALQNSRAKTSEEIRATLVDDDGNTHEEALVAVLDNAFEQTFEKTSGWIRKRINQDDRAITLGRIERAFNPGEWQELQNAITMTFHSKVWDEQLGHDDRWALAANEVLGAYREAGWGFAGDETNARWTRLGNNATQEGRTVSSLVSNTPHFNEVVRPELDVVPRGDGLRDMVRFNMQNREFFNAFGLPQADTTLQRLVVEAVMDREDNFRYLTTPDTTTGGFTNVYRRDIEVVPDVNHPEWDTAIFRSEVPLALRVPARDGQPSRLIRIPNARWSPSDVSAVQESIQQQQIDAAASPESVQRAQELFTPTAFQDSPRSTGDRLRDLFTPSAFR